MINKKNTLYSVLCVAILTICGIIPFANNSFVYANEDFNLTCKSSLLLDYNSQTILFENNADAKLPIASMVKMMTLCIVYEEIENGKLTLDTMITTTEHASGMGGSQVFIDPFVEYSADSLIKSVIMASANDSAVALAEHISGSEENFVKRMNQKAKELNMNNTLYANATGLPKPEQYSTARDCATILQTLIENEHYHKYSIIYLDEFTHPSGRVTELVNTNKLVKYYDGCDGGKTGSTNEAGYCLSTTAKRDDMRLISVVVGSTNGSERFKDTTKLLNFGFENFYNKLIIDSNVPLLNDCKILNAKQKEIEVFAKNDFYSLTKKGTEKQYETIIEINKKAKAPLSANDKVGTLIITKDGAVVCEIDIIVKDKICERTFYDNFKHIAKLMTKKSA